MKSWAPLKVGDLVDVVAPGFSTTNDKLQAGVEFLKKLGLRVRVPQDLFAPDVVCANTDAARFAQFKKALLAKDSKAIWCVRAGYGSIRIIEKIAKIKAPRNPKLFVGYSDACTIHNYLNQFWKWPTLHAPLLDKLGQHTLPLEQVNELFEVVFGNREKVRFEGLEPLNAMARRRQKVRGAVVGGNLVVTQSHLGTPFARSPKGQILVFEDTGERGYRVDRCLKHLEMAGYFRGVKAIVFGDFIGGQEPDGTSKVNAVIERFAREQKTPVFRGLEMGHGERQRPVPLGSIAELIAGPAASLAISAGWALTRK
jgi:muramoyltetrapeptide carboxypeptidase